MCTSNQSNQSNNNLICHQNILLYNIPTCYSLFPAQHFVAQLCTSQGRSNRVFQPSPSVLHSTSPDYCALPKDIADLVTAQATPLPASEICPLPCEASLCTQLADLKITPRRDTPVLHSARRYVFVHNNAKFLSMHLRYDKENSLSVPKQVISSSLSNSGSV